MLLQRNLFCLFRTWLNIVRIKILHEKKKATFYNVSDEYFDSLLNPLEEDIKQTKNIIQTKQGTLV